MIYRFPCNVEDEHDQHQNETSEFKGSPCCHYIGKLITENLEFVLLVMNYGIPGFITDHSKLAEFLGFNGNKTYHYVGSQLTPFCEIPDGGSSDLKICSTREQRLIWSTNGVCTAYNAIPMKKMYQASVNTNFLNKK